MKNVRPRPRRNVSVIATWLAYALIACFAIGWATLIIVGNLVWETDDPKPPAYTPPEPTRITWMYQDTVCADGWDSPSIGRRGACSHHGGVIDVYVSSTGNLHTTCPPRLQPGTLERARQLADASGLVQCAPKG
ncbi:hypothetical protein [Streptomyces sp. MS1.AVA.4]|uniref:Uncharacterized protein n=1 Tax=Streptomyces pratisoli TaxID=3139917 RepID=A0ACC6QVL6_9ACTN